MPFRRPFARPVACPVRRLVPRAALAAVPAAALLAVLPLSAQAQDRSDSLLCSQPVEPTCVDSEITYENEQRINRCRRDVERYAEQVREYTSCLNRKAELQIEEMEELQDSFASRAEAGGSAEDGNADGEDADGDGEGGGTD